VSIAAGLRRARSTGGGGRRSRRGGIDTASPKSTVSAVAALVAITLLLLTGPLAGPAQAGSTAVGTLVLELTELSPRIVTADGPDVLTVAGTLTNTGNEPIGDIAVRVQRGEPLRTEGEVRGALDGDARTDAVSPEFLELPGELAPGQSLPVRLAVPLRGQPGEGGLALTRPGVHEVIVNVNGRPRDSARARLTAVRVLLPVLAPPGAPTAAPADDAPHPFTLLYPVTDPPRRLPTVPGEPVLLGDDELATSLAPGGRLYSLVTALAERAPVGTPVRAATCLAVDPDLVATAAAMRDGYEVVQPDGSRVPGTGAEAARGWLDTLTATARGGCVLPLPYADADLVALTRGGLADLASQAVADGRAVLDATLGIPMLTDVVWPADGVLDAATLTQVVIPAADTVVLSAEGVSQGRGARTGGILPLAGVAPRPLAVLSDPLLTRAAAGPPAPPAPAERPATTLVTASTPAGGGGPLATQDAIGALVFRALDGPTPAGAPLVLAPPHRWAADGTAAAELLTAAAELLDAGLLTPRRLDHAAPTGTGSATLVYPLRAGSQEVPPSVVDAVRATRADIVDLRSAALDGGVGVSVDDVFSPLLRGLVRPTAAAWRGRPEEAARSAEATAGRIAQLRASVRVLEPPSPYSLGTADAPLLLTVANGLPVTVSVRVEVASTSGLRVAPIPAVEVPALGRRQVTANAEVTRSGQFVVDAALRTPDGGLLGPPSRLRLRSTAYGTITMWLTGIAGALLVVLAARRVVRRVRAADREGRDGQPPPGPEAAPEHRGRPGGEIPTVPLRRPPPPVAPGRRR